MDESADDNAPAAPRKGSRFLLFALLLLAAIVAALWYDTRGRIGSTQEELARRLQEIESETRAARTLARTAQDGLREALTRVGALEARLAESQSQQVALEALYQELSRNRDEWQLAEIEQVLAIAQQQLQLSGNVRAALLALQLAESRLSRADRPQFLPVRRALTRDIERLKSLPALDLPGLSLTLDRLVASVDALPLAFEERVERPAAAKPGKGAGSAAPGAAAGAAAPPPAEEGYFARLGGEIWRELRQLVVVRRIDTPEPPLLLPPQAYFLRENLKLKLLSARLSLLTRDEAGYREDLRTAQAWIQRYFDAKAKNSQAALAQLKQLSAASVSFEPPSIVDSLEAVRGFKARRERTS
jgi:uroporphyrin-3 C-methyltransferase